MTAVAELFAARRFVEALPILEARLAEDPHDWGVLADLTVARKHAGDFEGVRAAGTRALELGMPADDGSAWNVGIAATALGDWALARQIWAGLGIPIEAGEHPIDDERFGGAFVRVGGDAPEVLWCRRLCPARAQVVCVPFPESGRRHGDVLLHDGESRGRRQIGKASLPVFDELAVVQRSPFSTTIVRIEASSNEDVDALGRALGDACVAWEDWTDSVAFLCAACSAGTCASHPPQGTWNRTRAVGLATTRRIEDAALAAWEAGAAGRAIIEILEEGPEG